MLRHNDAEETAAEEHTFTVGIEHSGARIDAVLANWAAALSVSGGGGGGEDADVGSVQQAASRAPPPAMMAGGGSLGPVGQRMHSSLASALSPLAMELIDESDQHAGHAGAKGFDGESHFVLTIVSDQFEGVRSLKRHQMVYAAIGDDMQKVHALSINARSPSEPRE